MKKINPLFAGRRFNYADSQRSSNKELDRSRQLRLWPFMCEFCRS